MYGPGVSVTYYAGRVITTILGTHGTRARVLNMSITFTLTSEDKNDAQQRGRFHFLGGVRRPRIWLGGGGEMKKMKKERRTLLGGMETLARYFVEIKGIKCIK